MSTERDIQFQADNSVPLHRHVYDGERCRFCGINMHDSDMLFFTCVPREPMIWTSETPVPKD